MRRKRLTYLQTRKVSIQRTELNKKNPKKQNRMKKKKSE